jgi:EAL domain-containing protein (putative c-di-GMP-specific phosphodiesterase class I)
MVEQAQPQAACKLIVHTDADDVAAKLRAALREAPITFRETEPCRFEAAGSREQIAYLFRHCGLWLSTPELEQCRAVMLVDQAPQGGDGGQDQGLPKLRDVLARWWATGLAEAVDPERLGFRFQRVVSLAAPDKMLGFEALLVLRPDGSRFPPVPDRLLDAAARASLLTELDEASLECALRQARSLPEDALLFVNCMPETIIGGGLGDQLARSCRAHGRAAKNVVLEINVSRAVRLDAVALTRSLRALRSAGPKIALDRIDAEPWALDLVGVLEPDYLKIEHSLVHQVHCDPLKQARLEGLLRACQQCGATPIAVGIEEGAEESWLKRHGISWGQGFLFGLPEERV